MNIIDLTPTQLKKAATIKEQINRLERELRSLLGVSGNSTGTLKKQGRMSASAKKRIAAAQKARWANRRRAKPPTRSVKPAAKAKKKIMSPAARRKLSVKLKAYWAQKKAGKQ